MELLAGCMKRRDVFYPQAVILLGRNRVRPAACLMLNKILLQL
jgi:hypothetical protein